MLTTKAYVVATVLLQLAGTARRARADLEAARWAIKILRSVSVDERILSCITPGISMCTVQCCINNGVHQTKAFNTMACQSLCIRQQNKEHCFVGASAAL